jgi:predicted nucleic acid-binding protein
MNGPTDAVYVFDTNTVIGNLNGKTMRLPAGRRFISIITEMEVLAKPDITPEAERDIQDFLKGITIIPLSGEIKWEAIRIRRTGSPRLKLPDAIVAATAVILNARLVTADERLIKLTWPDFTAILPPSLLTS